MVPHKVIDSFNAAIAGIVYVLKSQRNMRIHFLLAALVILLSVILGIKSGDLIFLLSAVVLVLVAEMLNTAIELMSDIIEERYHPLVRIVKDIGAGAVFIASLYALAVGYLVFFKERYLLRPLSIGLEGIRRSSWHVAFVCLALVTLLAVIIKVVFHRGTPFRGGLPSVHTALAFSVFSLVALFPGIPLIVVFLVLFLALLLAQTRISSRIHSLYEVVSGAVWGVALTYFLFKLLY